MASRKQLISTTSPNDRRATRSKGAAPPVPGRTAQIPSLQGGVFEDGFVERHKEFVTADTCRRAYQRQAGSLPRYLRYVHLLLDLRLSR